MATSRLERRHRSFIVIVVYMLVLTYNKVELKKKYDGVFYWVKAYFNPNPKSVKSSV